MLREFKIEFLFQKERFLPRDTCFHDSGMPPSQNQSKQGSAIPDKPAQAATGISAPSLAGTPRGAHPHAEEAQSLLLGRGQRGAGGIRTGVVGTLCPMAEPECPCLLFTFSFAVKELKWLHCQEPREVETGQTDQTDQTQRRVLTQRDAAFLVSQEPRVPSGHQAEEAGAGLG